MTKNPRPSLSLTFDDGPEEQYTAAILDILQRFSVPATFFCVGKHVVHHPTLMHRIVNEGHAIGNHSWDHVNLTTLASDQIRDQLQNTQDIIHSVTGFSPKYVRPPFGAINSTVEDVIIALGFHPALWTIDSTDWQGSSAPHIAHTVLSQLHPGAVVLFHSAAHAPGTPLALETLIHLIQNEGYCIGPLDEVLP